MLIHSLSLGDNFMVNKRESCLLKKESVILWVIPGRALRLYSVLVWQGKCVLYQVCCLLCGVAVFISLRCCD